MTNYDLSGNPLPEDTPPRPEAPTQPPFGAPPQTNAVWPPPVGGYGNEADSINNSGQRSGVPPAIAALKWNWGAFLIPFWWALSHKVYLWMGILAGCFVLSFVPFVNLLAGPAHLGVTIYLGLSGHRLGWEYRRFDGGLPQFFDVQKSWLKWGLVLLAFGLFFLPILAAILFPVFAKVRENARIRSGYYLTHPQKVPANITF